MAGLTAAPVLLFLAAVLGVLLLAARAARRFWRQGRALGRADRVWLGLAAVGLACFSEGAWVEPYWPEVTFHTLASARLPRHSAHVRIVHLSDIHSDAVPRLEERLPGIIAAERPDLITYSGDSVNGSEGIPVFRRLLTALARIAPTYVLKGNWDINPYYRGANDLFAGTGAIHLDGVPRRFEHQGTVLWISGADYLYGGEVGYALAPLPETGYRVFVYHVPDEVEQAVGRADLYLSGHTHGGQVCLPGYGALITMSRFGKRFESGLYQEGSTALYVSRGIGMEGGNAPRVRFWCRPEIAVIDLVGPR